MKPCTILRNVRDPFGDDLFYIMELGEEIHLHSPRRSMKISLVGAEFADYVLRTKEGVARECEVGAKEKFTYSLIYRPEGYYSISFISGPLEVSFVLPESDAEFLASYFLQGKAANEAEAQEGEVAAV